MIIKIAHQKSDHPYVYLQAATCSGIMLQPVWLPKDVMDPHRNEDLSEVSHSFCTGMDE